MEQQSRSDEAVGRFLERYGLTILAVCVVADLVALVVLVGLFLTRAN